MSAPFAHDALGVCSGCLSELVAEWVSQFEASQDTEGERHMQHSYLSATKEKESWRGRHSIAVIAERVGISSRSIDAILHVEHATTSLSLADEILVALDRVHLLQSMTVYKRTRRKLCGYYGGHICAHNLLAVETASENGTSFGVVESPLTPGDSDPAVGNAAQRRPVNLLAEKAA